jgi:hypothetical protein
LGFVFIDQIACFAFINVAVYGVCVIDSTCKMVAGQNSKKKINAQVELFCEISLLLE